MAHKKGVGSSRNGRDSNPKMLGVKRAAGQFVHAGTIIARQNGTHFHPGRKVGIGSDYTIYARVDGDVLFHRRRGRKMISVIPGESEAQ